MPDTKPLLDAASAIETYDLCIIGAGVAGLNALFVAAQYLSSSQRIVLIDRKADAGGMWNDAYDFVRLHQPHGMFTVGNIKWDWSKPRGYLAKRGEVQAHMRKCLDQIRKDRSVTTYFGTDVTGHAEINTDDGPKVQITAQSGDHVRTILADRMIDARSLDIGKVQPMALTSGNVVSTTPDQMHTDGSLDSDAPAYIVGGGKTAMDTILALMSQNPKRKLTLIKGPGTVFVNRDRSLPSGMKRYYAGTMIIRTFGDIAARFDGTNEDDVAAYFRKVYAISPDGQGDDFLYGLLSEHERDVIALGLTEIRAGYLADVTDAKCGPQIQFRDGDSRDVPEGSIFVSCTGHIFGREMPFVPAVSAKGRILSISPRDAAHFLTSVGGYFLPHLFFRGMIRDVPLYLLDNVGIAERSRKLWHMATATQAHLNAIELINALPFKVSDDCGLDIDRWFPMHRRLAALVDIKVNHARYIAHARTSLDIVHDRLGLPKRLLTTI